MQNIIFYFRICFSLICLLLVWTCIEAQVLSFDKICALDLELKHSSGILSLNQGRSFWTQVDNNSPNLLYEIDENCVIIRSLFIKNSKKRDWEDICADTNNNIYIGDFGNNANDRKDLKILILPNPEQHTSDSIDALTIHFRYASQNTFPPPATSLHYDLEAMVWFDDSLHLFSKNRTSPFDGFCYHYILPAVPGTYAISPVDSFKTGNGPMLFYWITGAAVDFNSKSFALLSHDKIWLFKDFIGNRFFSGKVQEIMLNNYSQKEGICAVDRNTWFITDEYNSVLRSGGDLYKLELQTSQNQLENNNTEFSLFENPSSQILKIIIPDLQTGDEEKLDVFDFTGKKIKHWTIRQAISYMPIEELSNGIYIIRKQTKKFKKAISKKFLKL